MANLFDRLTGKLGDMLDDVTLPERLQRRLDEAEQALHRGDAPWALAALDAVDAEKPGVGRSLHLRAWAQLQLNDPTAALATARIALGRRESAGLHLLAARAHERLGDLSSARQHLGAALEHRPTDPERLEILNLLASIHERASDWQRAVGPLRQALRLRPTEAPLLIRLARALRASRDPDGAIQVLEPALRMEPAPLDALVLSGQMLVERGRRPDLDNAAACFRRILDHSSDNLDALEGLGQALLASGLPSDARPVLQSALEVARPPRNGRILRHLAECWLQSGELERALEALRTSVSARPEDTKTLQRLAEVSLRLGLAAEARMAAEMAARLAPTDTSIASLHARALLELGELGLATPLVLGLRASHQTADTRHALAEFAFRTGDFVEAISLFRETNAHEPQRPGIEARLVAAYEAISPRLPELTAESRHEPGQLAPFLDALGEAVASHPLLNDLLSRATALRQHLDAPLSIAILGEFNAGKSTFINAFVGEDMVATGVLPTTSHVNVIQYGPRRTARWTAPDGRVQEISYAAAVELVKRSPDQIRDLEFCYPHPDLRTIHFWDTPGFNAPDPDHEARARVALATADVVVWLVDANQALTGSEFEHLSRVPDRREKLLVVVNKVDRLADRDVELPAIVEHLRTWLGDECLAIVPLSALRALAAKKGDPAQAAAALEAAGWTYLEQVFAERVFDRAGRLKSIEVARALGDLTREALERTLRASKVLATGRTRVVDLRTELATQASRWPATVVSEYRADLSRQQTELRLRVISEVLQLSVTPSGFFGRRALLADDVVALRQRVVDWSSGCFDDARGRVTAAVSNLDTQLIGAVEEMATALGPPESRTLRRRVDAFVAETSALRLVLEERVVRAPAEVVRTRLSDFGDSVLGAVADEAVRTEAERDAHVRRILPALADDLGAQVERWAGEYFAACARLCDQVERDLDIVAIDLEHRIDRPFRHVSEALVSTQSPLPICPLPTLPADRSTAARVDEPGEPAEPMSATRED